MGCNSQQYQQQKLTRVNAFMLVFFLMLFISSTSVEWTISHKKNILNYIFLRFPKNKKKIVLDLVFSFSLEQNEYWRKIGIFLGENRLKKIVRLILQALWDNKTKEVFWYTKYLELIRSSFITVLFIVLSASHRLHYLPFPWLVILMQQKSIKDLSCLQIAK